MTILKYLLKNLAMTSMISRLWAKRINKVTFLQFFKKSLFSFLFLHHVYFWTLSSVFIVNFFDMIPKVDFLKEWFSTEATFVMFYVSMNNIYMVCLLPFRCKGFLTRITLKSFCLWWTNFRWTSSWFFREKDLSHSMHLWSFIFSWIVFLCLFKLPLSENVFPQESHMKSFLFSWMVFKWIM